MTRIIIYCEGPTEETFINQLLVPYMAQKSVFISASSCDGVSKYALIRRDVTNLCREDRNRYVTTMLDYYGLPSDTPGMSDRAGVDFYSDAETVEKSVEEDIDERNFHMNLMIHEFESLLFSDPAKFSYSMNKAAVAELMKVTEKYPTPEAINNSPETAPSKRILKASPDYSKIIDGYNIAKNIGLDKMREKCRHFNKWLEWMENTERTYDV